MNPPPRKLPDALAAREALKRIEIWRRDPSLPAACPLCEARGLAIVDRSARPYAEWHAVQCRVCGLDDVVYVPLGSVTSGGE